MSQKNPFFEEEWKGYPSNFCQKVSSSLLSPFCFAVLLYLITLSTQRIRKTKNLFQKHSGAIELALENIIRCSHGTNFGKLELFHQQLWSFPSRTEKRVFVWVRIQPQGLCQPLWVGWVGEPLEKPNAATSIALRTKLHLVYYKQTNWEWVLAEIFWTFWILQALCLAGN